MISRGLIGGLALLLWGGLLEDAFADDLYSMLKNRTCVIVGPDGSRGTGFVIDRERHLVVTNFHVAQSDNRYQVFWSLSKPGGEIWTHDDYLRGYHSLHGKGFSSVGLVVAQDSTKDLAVMWVDNLPDWVQEMPLADATPSDGDVVHVVGHPTNRLPYRYSVGQVSFVGWNSWTYENINQFVSADILQFRTQSYGGFSGSAVANEYGELVGVLSGSNTTVATAIQANEVAALLDSVRPARAFSIHNERDVPVRFQIKIRPTDDWESMELAAGHYHWWWTADEAAEPSIRFDYHFADGFQEKVYNLDTLYAIAGKGATPPSEWRMQYKFVELAFGVDLYTR